MKKYMVALIAGLLWPIASECSIVPILGQTSSTTNLPLACCKETLTLLCQIKQCCLSNAANTCQTEITSLPHTIKSPGTYCVRRSLSVPCGSSTGITINSSDVTLNFFGAGTVTHVSGHHAIVLNGNRITVNNANIIWDTTKTCFTATATNDPSSTISVSVTGNALGTKGVNNRIIGMTHSIVGNPTSPGTAVSFSGTTNCAVHSLRTSAPTFTPTGSNQTIAFMADKTLDTVATHLKADSIQTLIMSTNNENFTAAHMIASTFIPSLVCVNGKSTVLRNGTFTVTFPTSAGAQTLQVGDFISNFNAIMQGEQGASILEMVWEGATFAEEIALQNAPPTIGIGVLGSQVHFDTVNIGGFDMGISAQDNTATTPATPTSCMRLTNVAITGAPMCGVQLTGNTANTTITQSTICGGGVGVCITDNVSNTVINGSQLNGNTSTGLQVTGNVGCALVMNSAFVGSQTGIDLSNTTGSNFSFNGNSFTCNVTNILPGDAVFTSCNNCPKIKCKKPKKA